MLKRNLAERQEQMRQRQRSEGHQPEHEIETPYTVPEVARLTGFSVQTVIRIFEHERGVLVYEVKRPRKRASYRSIRIPRHVFRRVIQELTLR